MLGERGYTTCCRSIGGLGLGVLGGGGELVERMYQRYTRVSKMIHLHTNRQNKG